jgi:methylenetetrahydrofolate dehydrogenase (NADP+) / methenyltetrahydrofolate cyclohydrolase
MSQARIIDGKASAQALCDRLAVAVADLRARRAVTPGLAVIIVGDDPASAVYVRNKGEKARALGMYATTCRLAADVGEDELLRLVRQMNADPSIHGILVQLPLPPGLNASAIMSAIDPAKDVDGFHPLNVGALALGLPTLVPCTPLGCLRLLCETLGDLRGLRAVIAGRSNIVGKPMAQLLLAADCTVSVGHSRSHDLPGLMREADIVVAAVGRPELVRGDWIREGATVIDVGINRVPARDPQAAAQGKTRLVGDVAYEEAAATAGAITPVPGGVGPMTIACLMSNVVTAAYRASGLEPPAEITP